MMNNKTNSQDRGESVSISQIKLAIDVHASQYVVVRQVGGQSPQPAQRFTPEEFIKWVEKQCRLGQVYSCYEAGAFGFMLHRKLEALGVSNVVVRPRKWDDYGKRVRTDKSDANALCQELDRYVRGNRKALAVVRVPTPQQEVVRSQSRLREALQRGRQRMEAQGRSLFLYYGERVSGPWWRPARWEALKGKLPTELIESVESLRCCILAIDGQLREATGRIERAAPAKLIKGYGALSQQCIEREIGDWRRFKNRRQIASFTGMVPSEESSALDRRLGSITKHGNPRLRRLLIETAWRWAYFQPGYKAIKHWSKVLHNPRAGSAARKKAIVAVGRRMAIDLWRMNTGRCAALELGLQVNA
jgi:transposase